MTFSCGCRSAFCERATAYIDRAQCLSSITEFPHLIATIQTMKHLNPLQVSIPFVMWFNRLIQRQMRRAVRDYKYEVNEGRMTEECNQYLAQLQKDWERHRVKIGVEQLRKEVRFLHYFIHILFPKPRHRSESKSENATKVPVARLLSTRSLWLRMHCRSRPLQKTLHSVISMHYLIEHKRSCPGNR